MIWKKKYHHRWIQQDKTPDKKKIFHEIKYSLITMVIFGCVGILTFTMRKAGWTMIYTDISEYGWGYFFLSLAALILLHDTYFYWAHRWMHHPKIFKYVHQTHHVPTNPSPWAAFAFGTVGHDWKTPIPTSNTEKQNTLGKNACSKITRSRR